MVCAAPIVNARTASAIVAWQASTGEGVRPTAIIEELAGIDITTAAGLLRPCA
jgi:hypothetical protein